jgi:hypothetical protein
VSRAQHLHHARVIDKPTSADDLMDQILGRA